MTLFCTTTARVRAWGLMLSGCNTSTGSGCGSKHSATKRSPCVTQRNGWAKLRAIRWEIRVMADAAYRAATLGG